MLNGMGTKIGQYSAELRRFPRFQYGAHPPSWIYNKVTFYHSVMSETQFSLSLFCLNALIFGNILSACAKKNI